MKKIHQGHAAIAGIVVVVFVVLIGALGYTYLMASKSETAIKNPSAAKSIAAETASVRDISSPQDLDTALSTLDAAGVDNLSDADLTALEQELNSL
jgi:predicted permease